MKKGFTLIELLAVITILAIILLIAVPVMTSIISNAKEKSNEDSVNLYGKAIENAINDYYVKYPLENEVTIKQLEDGGFLNLKGNKVECDTVRIIDRDVYLANCKVGEKDVNYTYGEIFGKLVKDLDNDGKLSVGDKYSCKVNHKNNFNFYVLSLNDNNTVNLIMEKNICEDGTTNYTEQNNYCRVAWNDAGLDNNGRDIYDPSKGPVTMMQYLYNATKNWSNVPNVNMEFINSEYNPNVNFSHEKKFRNIKIKDGIGVITDFDGNEIKINSDKKTIKSRPIFKSESQQFNNSYPEWLVQNLYFYDANIDNTLYGDVDGDGVLTSDDAQIIRKYIAHSSDVYFDKQLKKIADADLSGNVDGNDVFCIATHIENPNSDLPCLWGGQYEINKKNVNIPIYGYWVLEGEAIIFQNTFNSRPDNSYAGVRPVITVPINYLAN